MIDDFSDCRITVMGLGRFGGGLGVTRWLARQGARIVVTDRDPAEKLADSLKRIDDLIESGQVTMKLGGHDEADFRKADLIVANPAVPHPWNNPFLLAARNAGIPITNEIRLLMERVNRHRIIGVTGTAGKSTVTAMIHHLLVESGFRGHLGGNIGGSLLGHLDAIGDEDWIVLELSSAMLYWLGEGIGFSEAQGISPHVAVLTNIEPNHLDWHETIEHYEQSKRNIFRYQNDGDHQVTTDLLQPCKDLPLTLPGDHNQLNGQLAVMTVLKSADILPAQSAPRLASFEGLPHRLQLVAQHDGQRFYDDSKSTTPKATILAVQAFEQPSKVHLIAGGYDKKIDLKPIAELAPKIGGLYTIGATGQSIVDQAKPLDGFTTCCESLDRAVESAVARMSKEDILLLSPGCASWDQFDNYEQRGKRFAELVRTDAGTLFQCSQEHENIKL